MKLDTRRFDSILWGFPSSHLRIHHIYLERIFLEKKGLKHKGNNEKRVVWIPLVYFISMPEMKVLRMKGLILDLTLLSNLDTKNSESGLV